MIGDNQVRARADALFSNIQQPQTKGEQALEEYRRRQESVLVRTARLRSLRLSRDDGQAVQRRNARPRRTTAK